CNGSGLGGCVRGGSFGRGLGLGGGRGLREQFLLPLGERLGAGLGLGVCGGVLACTRLEALGDGRRDDLGQQRGRADRIVVTRDRVVDEIGIAVGVEDRDDRDVQLASLTDG